MTEFLSKAGREAAQDSMDKAGGGTIYLVCYNHGGATAFQKNKNQKWYAHGVRAGFDPAEVLEPLNIVDVRLIWEDDFDY